jgi:tRNA pseudouridine(38-40) synthase
MLGTVCRHLPVSIRVFAVQRVNARFNGRSKCSARTYDYFVPAAALKLTMDGGQQDREILKRLQRALDCFVGDRPFHNYTKRCFSPSETCLLLSFQQSRFSGSLPLDSWISICGFAHC